MHGLRDKKRGAPVLANAENCSLTCPILSGIYSVTQVGQMFIEEWHMPRAFMAQFTKVSGLWGFGLTWPWSRLAKV